MASGVNVKMGVTGVAQFKQNMNQAKQSVKTLDAQLALTEKQFKASGDAQSYMTEKSELLKAKLEAQKKAIDNAEKALADMAKNGVDRSSKAYQDLYRDMLTAKSGMLDTTMAIEGIETASDNSSAALEDMSTELNNIGTQVSFETVTKGLTSITDGLQAAAKKAWELGKAIFTASLGSAAWADNVQTAADEAGMTTKQYQQMTAAAYKAETSVENILASQQKLAQATEKDNDTMDAIFARLGVTTKRYGEVRDLNDLFWETGEALMKIENDADRADMGKKLFGNWRELVPLFTMGRKEYEKLVEAQSYVDDEHIKNLTELDDSYQQLQHEIEVLKNDFFAELAPSIKVVTDSLGGLVKRFNEFLKTDKGKEMMQSLGDNIEKIFSSITNFDPEGAVKTVGDVMGAIEQGFQWIADNWKGVETGLKAIAAGWAAIKLATAGLNIAKLVSGLKGLTGGGGAGAGGAAGAAGGIGSAGAGATGAGGFWSSLGAGASKAFWSVGIPAAVVAAAITPALIANSADDRRVAEKMQQRMARASMMNPGVDRDWLERSATALGTNWHGGNEAEVEAILMGMKDRSDLQKAQLQMLLQAATTSQGNYAWNELQRLWGGEEFDMVRMNALLESVTDAYGKMNEQTDELTGSTDENTKASSEMTTAAQGLMTIPGLIQSAVEAGMSNVTFVLDGQVITNYVDEKMGEELNATRR